MTERRLFIAGATGAVGRALLTHAERVGVAVIPHVRPKSAASLTHPHRCALELSDPALADAMKGATTVVQLIGTMRHRFGSGDTYEASDIGTTQLLMTAAQRTGTIDHVVLLSSALAGLGIGAYLKAKQRAEAIVKESGLPFTIFRPSAFVDREGVPSALAGFGKMMPAALRGITLAELSGAILHVSLQRAPLGAVLEGTSLWHQVHGSKSSTRTSGSV